MPCEDQAKQPNLYFAYIGRNWGPSPSERLCRSKRRVNRRRSVQDRMEPSLDSTPYKEVPCKIEDYTEESTKTTWSALSTTTWSATKKRQAWRPVHQQAFGCIAYMPKSLKNQCPFKKEPMKMNEEATRRHGLPWSTWGMNESALSRRTRIMIRWRTKAPMDRYDATPLRGDAVKNQHHSEVQEWRRRCLSPGGPQQLGGELDSDEYDVLNFRILPACVVKTWWVCGALDEYWVEETMLQHLQKLYNLQVSKLYICKLYNLQVF